MSDWTAENIEKVAGEYERPTNPKTAAARRAAQTMREILAAGIEAGDDVEHKLRDLYALRESRAPKTIPVRIAVAVNKDGSWTSGGDSNSTDAEAILEAGLLPGDRLVWITANVPLPEETEVRGEVEE